MRRKNIYFGFGPAPKKERLTVYRRPQQRPISHGRQRSSVPKVERADLISALVNLGYDRSKARSMAVAAQGSDFDSQLRDALKRNPRILPEMTDAQITAIRKLIRGKSMAQRKRRTKKKNSRKGKMPAGLKAYWAKKRAAKAKRNPRKRRVARTNALSSYWTRRGVAHRPPPRKKAKRKKKNPRKVGSTRRSSVKRAYRSTTQNPQRLNLGNGFTAGQIKKVARAVARITGKRTRIVRP